MPGRTAVRGAATALRPSLAEQVDRQPVTTTPPPRLDRYPGEGIGGRVDDRAGEFAALVAASTTAAMGYQSEQAAQILAAAEREAPQRAARAQYGGT